MSKSKDSNRATQTLRGVTSEVCSKMLDIERRIIDDPIQEGLTLANAFGITFKLLQ